MNALQDALAAYGEDRNGDGKVVVTLNVYTLDYSDTETQTESAALSLIHIFWVSFFKGD